MRDTLRLLFKCETKHSHTCHTRRPTLSCPASRSTTRASSPIPHLRSTRLHSIPSRPRSGLPRATARPTLSLTPLAPTLTPLAPTLPGLHHAPHLPPLSKPPHLHHNGRPNGVPHRGARARTLHPARRCVAPSRARPSRAVRALEAGAWRRRVPRPWLVLVRGRPPSAGRRAGRLSPAARAPRRGRSAPCAS